MVGAQKAENLGPPQFLYPGSQMRIALFADVHANLPALEAVISHARAQAADVCWNLGDMIGYGPFPNEVIDCLRRSCVRHVLGNHDLKCSQIIRGVPAPAVNKDPDKAFSFGWTSRTLSAESLAFIQTIPRDITVDVEGVKMLLTHGSPSGIDDGLTPRTTAEKFRLVADDVRRRGIDLVLCGHTHEFFDRAFNGVRFINPGGTGRCFDGDARAGYSILDVRSGRVLVEPYRVEYSAITLAAAMRAQGFPGRLVRTLVEARSLEELDRITPAGAVRLRAEALSLGSSFRFARTHALQVSRLALQLFDALQPLHGLTRRERAYLGTSALLHDIGWVQGRAGHHKISRDLILKDRRLPLEESERLLVALMCRYHRRAVPRDRHKFYSRLTVYDRETLGILSALLRIADGLDHSHRSLVKEACAEIRPGQIIILLTPKARVDIDMEIKAARKKSDLLSAITGLEIKFARAGG
jgi:putative phosphoesterase